MASTPPTEPDETDRLLRDAARGDQSALRSSLERHRERLRRMVALRMDSSLSARVDASDVVQEALIDAAQKLAEYERERPLPFYPWLHRLTAQRLAVFHREQHRGTRSIPFPLFPLRAPRKQETGKERGRWTHSGLLGR